MSTPDATTTLCASIAAEWEDRPEYLPQVTEQVRAIHDKLLQWGFGPVERDDLDHATIMYSYACQVHECSGWLPFDVMPNWEDDLYCLLLDEDRWRAHVEANGNIRALAQSLRNEHQPSPPSQI